MFTECVTVAGGVVRSVCPFCQWQSAAAIPSPPDSLADCLGVERGVIRATGRLVAHWQESPQCSAAVARAVDDAPDVPAGWGVSGD